MDCQENYGRYEVVFPVTILPPRIELVFGGGNPPIESSLNQFGEFRMDIFERDRHVAWILRCARIGHKSRGSPEDLASRESWSSNWANQHMGELRAVESLYIQGLEVGVSLVIIWGPCFAIVPWMAGGCHSCVSVRPSPPISRMDQITDSPGAVRRFSHSVATATSVQFFWNPRGQSDPDRHRRDSRIHATASIVV